MRVAVVGVGNNGLNLLQSLRKCGVEAIGIDTDADRVRQLEAQKEPGLFSRADEAPPVDVWILTTSTSPNLRHLFGAADSITPVPGALISVESTLPVGTMDRLAARFAERGYRVGHDLFLAHVPHRIPIGDEESVFDAARVVAGVTPACRERAIAFYSPLVAHLCPVSDVRVAELAKIVENASRFVDIAFAEELFRYCQNQAIDFQELRAAVNTKANVQIMNVDYGIGGESLPKAIRFLQEALNSEFLAAALRVEYRHQRVLRRAAKTYRRILIKGITFKPGYPDVRFSPAFDLAKELVDEGKELYVYDPLLSPEDVAALGLTWGDPNGQYDLIYERPLAIMPGARQEKSRGKDPGNGQ